MTSSHAEWKSAPNATFDKQTQCARTAVTDHPLKITINSVERVPRRILNSQTNTGSSTPVNLFQPLSDALEGLDPLTQFAIQETDPLTQMSSEMRLLDDINVNSKVGNQVNLEMEPWKTRKNTILSKFTTSEKLSIITSFLSDGEKVVVKAQSCAVDKVQHRLDQLDFFEESSQRKLDLLSQSEYVNRIEELNKQLVTAWNSEQRVKALKITIQCSKLLADTDVLRFYPSKFVLITDVLDNFGRLVYERLKSKSQYLKPGSKTSIPLPDQFTSDMVPESAKETCRNWFYKIGSIRELVPRLYIGMAILKSSRFINSGSYSETLLRYTHMIRGIGNPLVAAYARCYLTRVGLELVHPKDEKKYLVESFYDFLIVYKHLFNPIINDKLKAQNMNISAYLTLYTPALDFVLEAVACGGSDQLLSELLDCCQKFDNNFLLLNTIMTAFKPSYIAPRTIQFLNMISQSSNNEIPPHILIKTLGLCVSVCPPAAEQRKQVITTVWSIISALEDSEHYINCVEVWIEFVVNFFSYREVNAVVGNLIHHMIPDRAHEKHYPSLKNIVNKIVARMNDIETLITMKNFLPLIDLFQQELAKVEICKNILSACNSIQPTSDPVIINTLMFLCDILHDSVNAFTVDDEKRQISELLCGVIKKVDYGREFDQYLNFYVEARSAFSNLDPVLTLLVQCVNSLAVQMRSVVKGQHTRKTGSFVRACAAYSFITIPSISSVQIRLDLYLLSGRVALFNGCLGQADACFKTALAIIPELNEQQNVEQFLVSYTRNFLSTLLVVPDSPDRGVLNLIRLLLNTLQSYQWGKQHGNLAIIYLYVLDLLSTMTQEEYPYHVDKVESNDSLYGSEVKFVVEVDKMCSLVVRELLNQMKLLGPSQKQASIALELINRIMIRSNFNNSLAILTSNLWQLAMKNGQFDAKYIIQMKSQLKKKNEIRENDVSRIGQNS